MKISVIIVSFNSEDFIDECINSVLKYEPADCEVIVLDNASSDKTVAKLNKYLNKIKLIKSEKNLGFAAGNNLAIRQAKGEYLFLLNPDTRLTMPTLEKLISFYETAENIGIVAPKLTLENGVTQESVKNFPTVWRAFKEYILGVKHAYSQFAPNTTKPLEVECVYAAAILIKTDLFNKINGFDPKFFMYYEDTDLCKRVTGLGKKIYYHPGVSITHLVGATKSDLDRNKLNYESSVIYHGYLGALVLQLIFQIPRLLRRLKLR